MPTQNWTPFFTKGTSTEPSPERAFFRSSEQLQFVKIWRGSNSQSVTVEAFFKTNGEKNARKVLVEEYSPPYYDTCNELTVRVIFPMREDAQEQVTAVWRTEMFPD